MPLDRLVGPLVPDRNHPLNRGRVAWWLTLPRTSGGAKLVDIWGNSHGTLNAVSSTSGWRGPGRPGGFGEFAFDGTAYAVAGAIPAADTTNWSWGVWLRPAGTTGNAIILASRGATVRYQVQINGVNTLGIYNGSTFDTPAFNYNVGEWVRLDVSRAGSTVKIYRNGLYVVDTLDTGSGTGERYTIAACFTDATNTPFGGHFVGGLDDAGIWNRGRSAAEIYSYYERSLRGLPDLLIRAGSPLVGSPPPPPITAALGASASIASVSFAGLVVPPPITAALGATALAPSIALAGVNTPPPTTGTLAAATSASTALAGLVVPPPTTGVLAAASVPSSVLLSEFEADPITAALAALAGSPSVAFSGIAAPAITAALAAASGRSLADLGASTVHPITATLAAQAADASASWTGFLDRYPDLKQAVMAAVAASPEVLAFVQGRIYPKHVPQTALLPAICYRIVSAVRATNLLSAAGMKEVRIRFEVVSAVEAQTETITESIRNRFQGIPKPISGIIIYYCSYEREVDIYHEPPPGSDKGYFAKQFDLLFKLRETVPNNF